MVSREQVFQPLADDFETSDALAFNRSLHLWHKHGRPEDITSSPLALAHALVLLGRCSPSHRQMTRARQRCLSSIAHST